MPGNVERPSGERRKSPRTRPAPQAPAAAANKKASKKARVRRVSFNETRNTLTMIPHHKDVEWEKTLELPPAPLPPDHDAAAEHKYLVELNKRLGIGYANKYKNTPKPPKRTTCRLVAR